MISPLIIQSEGQSLTPVVTIEDNKLCITWTIPKNPININKNNKFSYT